MVRSGGRCGAAIAMRVMRTTASVAPIVSARAAIVDVTSPQTTARTPAPAADPSMLHRSNLDVPPVGKFVAYLVALHHFRGKDAVDIVLLHPGPHRQVDAAIRIDADPVVDLIIRQVGRGLSHGVGLR